MARGAVSPSPGPGPDRDGAGGPGPVDPGPLQGRAILVGFLIGSLVALGLLVATTQSTEVPPEATARRGYVTHFAPPRTGLEVLLLRGDGQAYASIALDPALRHPEAFGEGPAQEAFFAQRPLFSYATWVLSAGRPDWLPTAIVVVSALAAGLLTAATVAALQARGRGQNTVLAPIVIILPNVLVALVSFGPDLLAAGLSVGGLALWRASPSRRGWAVGAFVLAVLARESAILVPVVLLGFEAAHRRLRARDLPAVVVPAGAYLLWLAFVRHQLAAGPEQVARKSSFSLPFEGLLAGAGQWTATDLVTVVVVLGVLVVTVVLHRRDVEAWVVAAYLVGAVFLNVAVWQSPLDIGRVLVPATVLAWVLWVPRSGAGRVAPAAS